MRMQTPIFGLNLALVGSMFPIQATAFENFVALSNGSQLLGCWRRPMEAGRGDIFVQLCFKADMSISFAYLDKYDGWSHGGSYSVIGNILNMIEDSDPPTHSCVFEAAGDSLSMQNCFHEGEYKKHYLKP
jgi:hypothetical protein